MTTVTDAKAAATARKARQRELEKVVVSKEDIEVVVSFVENSTARAFFSQYWLLAAIHR